MRTKLVSLFLVSSAVLFAQNVEKITPTDTAKISIQQAGQIYAVYLNLTLEKDYNTVKAISTSNDIEPVVTRTKDGWEITFVPSKPFINPLLSKGYTIRTNGKDFAFSKPDGTISAFKYKTEKEAVDMAISFDAYIQEEIKNSKDEKDYNVILEENPNPQPLIGTFSLSLPQGGSLYQSFGVPN